MLCNLELFIAANISLICRTSRRLDIDSAYGERFLDGMKFSDAARRFVLRRGLLNAAR